MHELSVVASLFDILKEKAAEQKAVRVTSVTLRVGRLSGVVPELLESAFDMYKKDTLAEGSSLEIVEVPLRVLCRACGSESDVEDFSFFCPACSSSDLEVISGTELFLEKMEVEIE